jgi:hypothetical protein
MQKSKKVLRLGGAAKPPLPIIISDHLKRERKPVNDNEFALYLAGLIQGCGTWEGGKSSPHSLILKFHSTDIALVYYLKKKIGYGQVKILPSYKEIHYIIKEPKGVSKVYDCATGATVLEGAVTNSPPHLLISPLTFASSGYWLTGFLDGVVHPEGMNLHLRTRIGREAAPQGGGRPVVKLKPTETLFELNLGFASSPAHSYAKMWEPRLKVPFPDIKIRWIFWQLDKYPLISSKFIKYLKFRKIYRICQRKEHLTKTGLIKILSLWRWH